MKKPRLFIYTIVICSIISACKDNSSGLSDAGINIRGDNVTLNPSGVAPLTATIEFEATITPPRAAFGIITLHRTERMKIYPD